MIFICFIILSVCTVILHYPFFFIEISHWRVPGGEGSWQQWSFRQMLTQSFTPIKVGESFGPTWSTHWFKVLFP